MNRPILFDLEDDIAVVTGACAALGAVWMEGLLAAGSKVVGVDSPEIPLSRKCRQLQDYFGTDRLSFIPADVESKQQMTEVRKEIETLHGVVTILVNNAGVDQRNGAIDTYSLVEDPACQFHDIFAINVDSAIQVTQVFAESMVKLGKGSIINIGPLESIDFGYYAANGDQADHFEDVSIFPGKVALVDLTKYLAANWAANGVRVNSLSMAGVFEATDEVQLSNQVADIPMGRLACEQDLMGPLVFLASAASSYLTGQELCVDGGFSIM